MTERIYTTKEIICRVLISVVNLVTFIRLLWPREYGI